MKYPQKLNIQHSVFYDGSFVLHKLMLGEHKYSAWFEKNGKLKAAELVFRNGSTRNVGERQVKVRAALAIVGKRYVGVGTEEARLRFEAEHGATAK
jgi:hypothetical protein